MAARRNKQVPPSEFNRSQHKIVRNPEQQKPGKPVWRFHTTDKSGPFRWPKGENAELTIVSKLHEFDGMTWGEIEGKYHHRLNPASLSPDAMSRLEEIQRDDQIDNLYSFHIQGKPRFVAYRDRDVANLLWYDPEHKVAPSKIKHT